MAADTPPGSTAQGMAGSHTSFQHLVANVEHRASGGSGSWTSGGTGKTTGSHTGQTIADLAAERCALEARLPISCS